MKRTATEVPEGRREGGLLTRDCRRMPRLRKRGTGLERGRQTGRQLRSQAQSPRVKPKDAPSALPSPGGCWKPEGTTRIGVGLSTGELIPSFPRSHIRGRHPSMHFFDYIVFLHHDGSCEAQSSEEHICTCHRRRNDGPQG